MSQVLPQFMSSALSVRLSPPFSDGVRLTSVSHLLYNIIFTSGRYFISRVGLILGDVRLTLHAIVDVFSHMRSVFKLSVTATSPVVPG